MQFPRKLHFAWFPVPQYTSFAPLHYVLLVVLLHWYPSTRSWGREAPRDPGYDGVSGRPCSLAEMAIPDAVVRRHATNKVGVFSLHFCLTVIFAVLVLHYCPIAIDEMHCFMHTHRIVRVRKREDHNRSPALCESNYVSLNVNRFNFNVFFFDSEALGFFIRLPQIPTPSAQLSSRLNAVLVLHYCPTVIE